MITLEKIGDEVVFRSDRRWEGKAASKLDDAIECRESGAASQTVYIKALSRLVTTYPDFIDGHAHLGYAMMESGRPDLGLEHCLRGLEIGLNVLPPEFAGRITWLNHENRPFLRAAHGVALSYLRLGRSFDGVQMMERMLSWNPNDNQGVRLLIGSEYLRLGYKRKSNRVFNECRDHFAPYNYDQALSFFIEGRLIEAATLMRLGFVTNGYIAEILSGNPNPEPIAIWPDLRSDPETARSYCDMYSELWRQNPDSLKFLRWLHMHPKVLAERAVILECSEALLWESDVAVRQFLDSRRTGLKAKIDNTLSEEIVRPRVHARGTVVDPWLYRSDAHR